MIYINFHTHRPTAEGVVTPRSFGIHPWHAAEEAAPDYETFEVRYRTAMAEAEWIGECGLDRVRSEAYERQVELFEWQLRLAEALRKPVVVHCVRAYDDLLGLRRRYSATPWVVHGFIGSLQLAAQLHRANIGVSFSAALLDPRRAKVRDTVAHLPYPFLLETDDAPCRIEELYQAAATLRGCSIAELADTIKAYLSALSRKEPLQEKPDDSAKPPQA